MTDVLILKRIPGLRPGQIVPLDKRLERHVKAGNAQVIPNASPSTFGTVNVPQSRPTPLGIVTSNPAPVVADDEDEATADEDDS